MSVYLIYFTGVMINVPLLTQIIDYTYYTYYITICQRAKLVQHDINYTYCCAELDKTTDSCQVLGKSANSNMQM